MGPWVLREQVGPWVLYEQVGPWILYDQVGTGGGGILRTGGGVGT